MKIDQLDWTAGLDESGWIAAILFIIFFFIVITTVVMMLKLRDSDNSSGDKNKPFETPEDIAQPDFKSPAKTSSKEDSNSSPIEEAEVFLTYGLNKQAIDVLEKHLKQNPSDQAAREMLERAQAET